MTKVQSARLRRILSYALSNQYCYEACDIQTRIGYVSTGAGDFVHHSKRKTIHCCVYSDRREIEMSHEDGYSTVTDEDSLRAFILEVQ